LSTPKSRNKIAEAICEQLRAAKMENQVFRVYFILPVHTEATFQRSEKQGSKIRRQHVSNGLLALRQTILNEFPDAQGTEHFSVCCLRAYEIKDDQCYTEQVAVNSKVLIVDDRIAIIGTAEISDAGYGLVVLKTFCVSLMLIRMRRMLSDRSEIGIVVEDSNSIPSRMNGLPYEASRFAISLRMRLMAYHLGLSKRDQSVLLDPVANGFFKDVWVTTMATNAAILKAVFPTIEEDERIPESFKELMRRNLEQGKPLTDDLSEDSGKEDSGEDFNLDGRTYISSTDENESEEEVEPFGETDTFAAIGSPGPDTHGTSNCLHINTHNDSIRLCFEQL
jgi:phosphatidylserine/phosphatidylglycerophosphate/cardiolipin synthase-like enzyme